MYEHGLAFADTFTGRTKVEASPGGGLDMVDERVGRHVLVATRAQRVGTDGHSTGLVLARTNPPGPAAVMYTRTRTRSLEVTWRPEAGLGST
jgi:hypothetical protein